MSRDRVPTGLLACVLAGAAVLAVVGLGMLRSSPALGAPVTDAVPPLVLAGDPPGTVHALSPRAPALWNVGVTLHRMPVSTLVGILTAHGGLSSADLPVATRVELLGCSEAWNDAACPGGERVIVPVTSTDALPAAAAALADPTHPVPANLWVQARVTMAADAPGDTSGRLDLRLTVDAFGADAAPGDQLAATGGSSPLGAGLLAIAAVSAGLTVSAMLRRRPHG